MKAFYTLIALMFLASCGAEAPAKDIVATPDVVQETVADIDQATEALPDTQEVVDDLIEEVNSVPLTEEDTIEEVIPEEIEEAWETEDRATEEQAATKVVELSTTYNNPKMEVVMNIEYSVDSDDKISEISVTSPNYGGMPEFNTWAQGVIGMTVEEASEYVVAGSSLTTPAFQAALKNG